MDAQLMGAARLRLEFEPGDRRAAPLAAAPNAPVSERLLPVRIDLHPPAAPVVEAAERQIDRALFAVRTAGDDRPISLGDPPLLEQKPQCLQRLVVTAENEAARGLAVEPMRERRLSRQAEPQGVKIVLEARAALRAPMNRDARRLVEDQHQPVAIEE